MPQLPEQCVRFAATAYVWLPLFLALIAGVCLLIATIRRTLTGGMAASLSALAGIVVIGTAVVAAHLHAPAPHPIVAPAPKAGSPEATAWHNRLESGFESLHGEVIRLQRRLDQLEARSALRPVPHPAVEKLTPPPAAPKPAAPKPPATAPVAPPEPPEGAEPVKPSATPTLPPAAPEQPAPEPGTAPKAHEPT